jgi:hypothetical protein
VSDLVTVFESSDVALLALAKAALEEAGIRYIAQSEDIQNLFGMGRLFSDYNFITGPPRIRVTPEDAARAREVLSEFGK